ncbi:HNH endonuclease [Rubinisphaera italica]|uniref:Putative HNH nuclease YajD n=1 Tax=Rubinisphaera italica TaxID=2527969 RepID=A0A5C5XQB0_9PLAN|nr:HNH endonuclease [Rubinisphaera italica]TWT64255.1 HNH endonuclease [Rubinisphaera italica]
MAKGLNFEHKRITKIVIRKPVKERPVDQQQRQKLYKSARWKKVRLIQLRSYPLCNRCTNAGRAGQPARQVHHIISIEEDIEKAFDLDNLESLCDSCHQLVENEIRRIRKFEDVKIDPETGLRIVDTEEEKEGNE